MFSQVSVCPQGGCMVRKGGGHVWEGACMVGGMCVAGETANAAGGMHPTGMHSSVDFARVDR